MTLPVRGAGGSLGIGVESAWGTAVARTNWLRMNSMGLRRMITNKEVDNLGSLGAASVMHRFNHQESDFAGGPLAWYAAYDDSTVALLAHIMGAVATSGPSGTQYTHLLTLASPVPVGVTLEQISGTGHASSITAVAEVFEGCKFAGARLSLAAGGLLTVETDVIAQTSGGLVAPGTPTYTTGGNPIGHQQTTGVVVGGTPRAFQSFVINIERDLQRRHELGSAFTSEPHEESLAVTAEFRTKWQASAFDSGLLTGAQADWTIPFLGTGDNALNITLHNVQINEVTREVGSRGSIDMVVRVRAFADGTDQGLALEFKNANNDATDN